MIRGLFLAFGLAAGVRVVSEEDGVHLDEMAKAVGVPADQVHPPPPVPERFMGNAWLVHVDKVKQLGQDAINRYNKGEFGPPPTF